MIDVHAHVVLQGVMGCAGPYGPEARVAPDGTPELRVGDYVLRNVRYEGTPFMDVDLRLSLMDDLGIELQALSPNPLTYFHNIDRSFAIDFCRWHNERMAEVVAGHPDRFVGFAQLPMQDVGASVVELTRGVEDLGLVGAYVGTEFGRPLDDPHLDDLYAACSELDVPLFLHPTSPGIDAPLPDPRVRRFMMDNWLSFLFEETMAVATLIFGGVLDRHPGLDICISHGGGATAMVAGRLAHLARSGDWSIGDVGEEEGFERRLRRLWFDNHVHDERAEHLLESVIGNDRLVLGTNFAGWDAPRALDQLPSVEKAARLSANARQLLRMDK